MLNMILYIIFNKIRMVKSGLVKELLKEDS